MKIVILSGANSIHTIRWANGLQEAGLEVYLISQHPLMHKLNEGIQYYELPNRGVLGYFLIVAQVKKLLLAIKPDIVNAHYASGYGTTARLVNYHPYVLSVWGSDIYLFPKKSFIHHWLVNKNLLASSYDDIRFEQSNEIYYCINSILKFMPWVRNIYLVTDQQTPFFLEEKYPKKIKKQLFLNLEKLLEL